MKKLITIIAAAGLVLGSAVAANATDVSEVWWRVPAGAQLEPSDHPKGDGFRVGSDGFPQTYLPGGEQDLQCGELAQVDIYPADVVEGLIADGRLDEGEDYDVIVSWRFVYGGDCEVDEPDNTVPDVPDVEVPAKLAAPSRPVEIQTAAR